MSVCGDLKYALRVCSLFGQTPVFDSKTQRFKYSKVRAFLYFALTALFSGYSLHGMYHSMEHFRTHQAFLGVAQFGILIVFNLSNVCAFKRNARVLNELLDTLSGTDKLLGERFESGRSVNASIALVACFNVTYLAISLKFLRPFNEWDFADSIKYYTMHLVLTMFLMMLVTLKHGLLKHLLLRMRYLNAAYENETFFSVDRLDVLVRIQSGVFDAIDCFNVVFGWSAFYVQMSVVLNLLLNVGMIYDRTFGDTFASWGLNVSWICYINLMVMNLINTCDNLERECAKPIGVLLKLKHSATDFRRYKKFGFLLEEIQSRPAHISAMGFFSVNYNMVYNFTNIIATYLIVIIQWPNERINNK